MPVETHDLPLDARGRGWNADEAEKRVRKWADAEEGPTAKYAQAFFWHAAGDDPDQDGLPDHFGDYKLPYADVIGGTLLAVPRAIFAVAARLGQTDIPDADKTQVQAAVNRYYARMAKEFDDDSIVSPFGTKGAGAHELANYSKRRHEFTMVIRAEALDQENRTAVLAFSSEAPVERPFGTEILDHAPGAVRLNRLNTGAPLLLNHDPDKQIGVVEHASVGADRKGRAQVRFSRGSLGREVFQDVQDGIRRLVSVGYLVHSEPRSEGHGVVRVGDWEPIELSIVPIPADTSVGIGRSAGENPASTHSVEDFPMEPNTTTTMPTPITTSEPNVQAMVDEARRVESERVRSIYGIASQWAARVPDLKDKADEYVREGRSIADFQHLMLERLGDAGILKPATATTLGLSEQEKRGFSIVALVNHIADLRNGKAPKAGSFEYEACLSATDEAKKVGRNVQGVLIPEEVLGTGSKREVQVGGSAGELVATQLLAADFIELLRNATPVMGLGPTVLPGLVGNIAIPRQTGGATAYWVAESAAPTETDQTFDQVALSPQTLAANTKYSRKTLLQATPAIEGLVRADLARVMGVEMDRACIAGSGASGQPTGILHTTGIASIVMTADAGNGGTAAWADVVAFRTALAKANALRGRLGWLLNAAVEGTLLTTQKAANYPVYILDAAAQPLVGSPYALTENVPSNGTKGSGTSLSAMVFGNFQDLLIGEWGGLDLVVDPYTYSNQGGVQITIFRDVDISVRHPASFAVATDVITS